MSTSSNEKVVTGVRTVNALLSGLHPQDDSDESLRDHSYHSDQNYDHEQMRFQNVHTTYHEEYDYGRLRYSDPNDAIVNANTRYVEDLNNPRISSGSYINNYGNPINIASGTSIGGGSNEYLSNLKETIVNAKAPLPVNETARTTVRLNGQEISGIWVNKDECLNWRGPIPLERYKISSDVATVIRKSATHTYDQVQNISVRYLKPPPLPPPGDLIIKEDAPTILPPAPPIIIRQEAALAVAPPTLIYREKPPRAPAPVPTQTITIPGKTIEPPPRQVIVERMAAPAPLPQDVIIERWLGYPKAARHVVYQKAAPVLAKAPVKNVLIDWESTDKTELHQKYHFLGVETADPIEYERRHGHELVETNRLPPFVSELNTKIPNGEQLASNVTQVEYLLTGDVDALKLVDKNKNLSDYLMHRF